MLAEYPMPGVDVSLRLFFEPARLLSGENAGSPEPPLGADSPEER